MAEWEVVYVAKPWAGEPAEGGEVDWAAKQWRGESHTVEYDDDYDRMPRVTLKETGVVAGSITVTLTGSAKPLELDDYTMKKEASKFYETWYVPAKYSCIAHRRKGDEYNQTYLYFNPALEGQEIDVVYRYYLTDAEIKCPVVFDGRLYFNEAGRRHRFLELCVKGGETEVKSTYSPRAGDRELACVAAGDDRVWAVSAPSNLLVQFGREWSGYVHEVDAGGKKIWNVVADLARACDQYCFDYVGTLYIVRRDTPTKTGTFPHVLKITKRDMPAYPKVSFGYAKGKVELGSGKPVLSLSCNYVYDKGHAEILCAAAYGFYAVKRRMFTIECAGVIEQFGLCEEKVFYYQGQKFSGIVTGRDFSPQGTTTFTVVEKVVAAFD
jgi:hypothetical protein